MNDLLIGLEIHIQLPMNMKLFSFSYSNNIDMLNEGVPGVLPVLNTDCITIALKVCHLVNCCNIADVITFDRKHYLYHDLPAGYQLTQYYNPIGKNGFYIFIDNNMSKKIVTIKQVHIESDAAKTKYIDGNLVIDYNRCGKGLVEVVTNPDFTDVDDVKNFLHLFISDVRNNNLLGTFVESGGIRIDVNVSYKDSGRIEIKNMNSPNFIYKAVTCLINDINNSVNYSHKTLGYNQDKNCLFVMRDKESYTKNYRYIIDNNIQSVSINNFIDNVEPINSVLSSALYIMLTYKIDLKDAILICEYIERIIIFNKIMLSINYNVKYINVILQSLYYLENNNFICSHKHHCVCQDIQCLCELSNLNLMIKKMYINNIDISNYRKYMYNFIVNKYSDNILENNSVVVDDNQVVLDVIDIVYKRNIHILLKNNDKNIVNFVLGLIKKYGIPYFKSVEILHIVQNKLTC